MVKTAMKILIVETVWLGGAKYGFFDKAFLTMFSVLPTLQARHIAAITPKKHTVELVNERYGKIDFEQLYDIVHINFTNSTTLRAYEIADAFREKGVPVVLSGLHASAMPEEAKQHADSVLLGWGELNWVKLLEDFEKNDLQPLYQPMLYTKIVTIPQTNIKLPGLVLTGAIEATRGCPYHCDFCRETHIPGGSQFYARPVDEVMEEIKSLPQKSFTFYDASLTIDPTYTKSLFTKMMGLHKNFSCNGNVDILAHDKELVKLSKQAGCVSWLIGFESVSQDTLDTIGKKTNKIDDYRQAIHNIHEQGMIVIGCFVFGFDTDTKDVFKNTLTTIRELEMDVADFLVLTPFPGTPLYNKFENEGRIVTKEWSNYTMKNVVYIPKNMTSSELLKGVRNLYNEFYSLPYTIRRAVRSMRYGLYPFLLVVERNFTAYMNRKRLFHWEKH